MSNLLNALLNGPAHFTESHNLSNWLTLIVVIGALLAEFVGVYVLAWLVYKAAQNTRPFIGLILRHFGIVEPDTEKVFLELTFPANTSKSAFATEQFNTLMRSGKRYTSLKEKLAAHKQLHSEEIYATHDGGIRYVMVVPETEVDYAEHSLRAYLPGLKIKRVSDYLPATVSSKHIGVIELRLANDFVLPLKDHKALEEHDPMAYLTGHMTKLVGKELIASLDIVYSALYTIHYI